MYITHFFMLLASGVLGIFIYYYFIQPVEKKSDKFGLLQLSAIILVVISSSFAFYASLRAIAFVILAEELGSGQDTVDIWQAVAALAQVPVVAIASISFYRWVEHHHMRPEIAIGVYNTYTKSHWIDFSKPLEKYTIYHRHKLDESIPSSLDETGNGVSIIIVNTGQKPLEQPRLKVTQVVPTFKNKTWNIYFDSDLTMSRGCLKIPVG